MLNFLRVAFKAVPIINVVATTVILTAHNAIETDILPFLLI
jgi:hypothetical protein